MRESFLFYRSFYEAISDLEPEDRMKVYDAICEYALNGTEPEISGVASAMFKMAKPQIDANNKRYENGKKGGRPPKEETEIEPTENQNETKEEAKENQNETKTKPKANQEETKTEPNVNVNVNVNDKEKDVSKDTSKKKAFVKPTLEEVRAYCLERQNGIDAERFIDYYESNGWKVGKNPMRDWRACVRSWEKNAKENKPQVHPLPDMSKMPKPMPASQNRFNNFDQRQYDFDNLEQAILAAQARDG